MAGKRGGLAARPGRGRTAQSLTRDAEVGQKRKAPDVLLSARKAAKGNAASNAAASARPGLTMTALQSTFRQQVLLSLRQQCRYLEALHSFHLRTKGACHRCAQPAINIAFAPAKCGLLRNCVTQAGSLEAQVQEQSIAELAGLTALETDLKRSAKASD